VQRAGYTATKVLSSTLVASMASVWNVMPSEIKEEEQEAKWKKKIKTFCAKNAHF
jgi:hypothetical protein